jgi:hypothetical protein
MNPRGRDNGFRDGLGTRLSGDTDEQEKRRHPQRDADPEDPGPIMRRWL